MNEHLILAMAEYFAGDPKQVHHTVQVQTFAMVIAQEEKADENTCKVLEAAAVAHDMGVKVAMELFGECNGKLQEELGPGIAEEFLRRLHCSEDVVQRAAWLVGHHHTYDNIKDLDHQILVEADFLANFYDEKMDIEHIRAAYKNIFKTETGKKLCHDLYGV